MYFCFSLVVLATQLEPLQLIPELFDVTIGAPVVSVTLMSTRVPEQTGMRWAVSPRELGSTMLPVMKLTTFALLLEL